VENGRLPQKGGPVVLLKPDVKIKFMSNFMKLSPSGEAASHASA
jgi:hypothetical protein